MLLIVLRLSIASELFVKYPYTVTLSFFITATCVMGKIIRSAKNTLVTDSRFAALLCICSWFKFSRQSKKGYKQENKTFQRDWRFSPSKEIKPIGASWKVRWSYGIKNRHMFLKLDSFLSAFLSAWINMTITPVRKILEDGQTSFIPFLPIVPDEE